MNMVEYRSDFILELRNRLGCSQDEFARIVGVTSAALSRWENGRARPKNSKWERLHDLDELLRQCNDTGRLKRKLLMAASLIDDEAPMDLLVDGDLESQLQSSIDQDDFLEETHLEPGLQWDTVLQRKLDHWVKLVERDEIPVANKDAWKELMKYVVPVSKLVKFLVGVGIMPAKSRSRFAKKVFWIDFSRAIKREPLTRLINRGTRVEGYAIVLGELAMTFDEYRQDCREIDDEDPEDALESVEDWWDRVSGWDGDERLQDILPRIKKLCRVVLEDVHIEYPPKRIEELLNRNE